MTTVVRKFGVQGGGIANRHTVAYEINFDTYASGGQAIDIPATLGDYIVLASATQGFVASVDKETKKVLLYTAGTEATTIPQSGVIATVLLIGQ